MTSRLLSEMRAIALKFHDKNSVDFDEMCRMPRWAYDDRAAYASRAIESLDHPMAERPRPGTNINYHRRVFSAGIIFARHYCLACARLIGDALEMPLRLLGTVFV